MATEHSVNLTNNLRSAVQVVQDLDGEYSRLSAEVADALRARDSAIDAHRAGHYTNEAHRSIEAWGMKAAELERVSARLDEARITMRETEQKLIDYYLRRISRR